MLLKIFRLALVVLCGLQANTNVFATTKQQPSIGLGEIVASIKPLHSLVQNVLGESEQARLIIKGQASAHDYQLKASQMRLLSRASMVIYIDDALETTLAEALDALPDNLVRLKVSEFDGIMLLPQRLANEQHGHGKSEKNAAQRMLDTHLWLDPDNAKQIMRKLAKRFALINPDRADQYNANAQKAIQQLNIMDDRLKKRLAAVSNKPFMVSHDAFQYFEHHYGLRHVGSVLSGPHQPVSIKRMRQVRQLWRSSGAVCLFKTPQLQNGLMQTVIEGSDNQQGGLQVLDPTGSNLEPGREHYFDLLNSMVNNVEACLSQ